MIGRRKFAIGGFLAGLFSLFGARVASGRQIKPEKDTTEFTHYTCSNLHRFLLSHKNEKVTSMIGCLGPRMYGIPGYDNGSDEPDIFYTIHFTGNSTQLVHKKLAAYLFGSIPMLQKHGIL